jgi:hypothetical protein
MDAGKLLKSIGSSLTRAKNLSTDLAAAKARSTKPPKSGTGVHSPGSFGVNAETQPANVRMAGGIGLQKVAAHLIHTGVNKFVMPQVEKQMQGLAEKIKTDLNNKQHLSKGGTFARKPSISM